MARGGVGVGFDPYAGTEGRTLAPLSIQFKPRPGDCPQWICGVDAGVLSGGRAALGFSRSSGPGGQNVNTTDSRVEAGV